MGTRLIRALALVLALGCAGALAQSWPQRPVRVIVPFPAGGNTDSQARIVTERLNDILGQPFVVENKAGAGGAIAAEYVVKSAPDGYTLFFGASPQFSLPLVQKVNFDPFKDFAPISIVGTNAFVLGVHVSVPANTVAEFVDYVKARPGQLNYASAGAGTTTHLTAALFLARAGLQMTHVPYKGGAPAVADLVGGQVQMYFGNASELIPHSQGGKVHLLAVSSAQRAPQLPDVPAIAETYPGFATGTWNGFLAPTGTPHAIIDRLAQEVAKVVHEPTSAERLRKIGVEPLGNTPAEFAALVQREAPVWRDAVKAAGIRAD
ncbi:MAG TPA: tripartite tricarboxylate transporter substrate binding protein [Burkholderiales bacterium]|nr:tripartite tricarboxylate transporter substrate binding protein [Burkholderiales bacterium]